MVSGARCPRTSARLACSTKSNPYARLACVTKSNPYRAASDLLDAMPATLTDPYRGGDRASGLVDAGE